MAILFTVYRMHCGISCLITLHILLIVCRSLEVTSNKSFLMLNAPGQKRVRITRQSESCECIDERPGTCTKIDLKCKCCPSESTFCGYKNNFGKAKEKLWGTLMCRCKKNNKPCVGTEEYYNKISKTKVLVDVQPEIGELQHTYVCPYSWNRSVPEPSWTMQYSTGFGLTFNVTIDLFHKRHFQSEGGTYIKDKLNESKENNLYYCFWIHQPYPLQEPSINYTLSINIRGSVTLKKNFIVYPKMSSKTCHPTCSLSPCSNMNTEPLKWSRGVTYTIKSTQSKTCSSDSTLSSTFRITRLGTSRETPPFPVFFHLEETTNWEWDYGSGNWYINITNSTEYVLTGRDLHFGLNAAVLEVVETPPQESGKTAAKNVVMCFFNVEIGPTRSVIHGSPVLKFKRGEEVKLDGTGSINFNVEDSKEKQTLGYSWSCWDKNNSSDVTVCKGRNVSLSKEAVFSRKLNFTKSGLYEFELTTYDKSLNNRKEQQKTKNWTTITVDVKISIPTRPVIFGRPKLKFERGEEVMLNGTGSINPNVDTSKTNQALGYSWSCWDKNNPSDLTVCKGRNVSLSKEAVFSQKLNFAKSGQYEFELTTYDKSLYNLKEQQKTKNWTTIMVDVKISIPTRPVIFGSPKLKFERGEEVTLNGTGSINPNVDNSKMIQILDYSWSCWDKHNSSDLTVCKGRNVSLSKEAVFSRKLNFTKSGLYEFELTTYDKSLNNLKEQQKTKNWTTIMVDVKISIPTRPVIFGSPELKFEIGKTVMLNGTGSINPNVDTSKEKQTLGYWWSCWDLYNLDDVTVCGGQGVLLSEDAVLYPNVTFVMDRLYVFQLMTYDKTVNDSVDRQKTENKVTVTVEVFSQTTNLDIMRTTILEMTFCVNLCGCSAQKTQGEEMVFLQASCTVACPDVIKYKWEILPNVSLPESVVFEPSDKLMIKRNKLKEGEKYTIIVRGGNNGSAEHTIFINKKPLPGKCDVTPPSGNVGEPFTLACTGFQDEDVDKPLTYKVYQEDAEWKCLLVVRVVSHPWTVELRGLQLMEGRPAKLTIEVVDFYGSVARTTVSPEVRAPGGPRQRNET